MTNQRVTFGVVASAADAPGTPDAAVYRTLLEDVDYSAGLGFRTMWLIEHHFSDYFPTPSPLLLASHIAGRFPELSLGTCVLVLPWYEPLRLAGEIAMLNLLSQQELHLGLGRGTAKYEFDAFGLDMGRSRERFQEVYEVISTALRGERFAYHGKQIEVPKEVEVRPRVAGITTDRIHFYGAIGSPGSASVMAEMGLPPLCTTIGDLDTLPRVHHRRDQADHDQLHHRRLRRGGNRAGAALHPALYAGPDRSLHTRGDQLGSAA